MYAQILKLSLPIALLLAVLGMSLPTSAQDTPPGALWMLQLDGAVGPSSADYLVRGIEQASEARAAAVLIRINTPGGLDSSMRDMIAGVLASPIPVICYVAPGGARAASAGTFLMYSCHIAAMAPATNLGAATPVSIGGPLTPSPRDPPPSESGPDKIVPEAGNAEQSQPIPQPGNALERKVTNDAVAYIRSLAELRGRNADWAERAVREGASLSASRALELGVIDLIAADTGALLNALAGREIRIGARVLRLDLVDAPRVVLDPDWRSEFLAVITNPNVAYILMIIGLYGLVFEFSNPGFGLPGILGLTCLLVALYAFQILPVSYAGLGLMLLGIGLIIAEVMLPSFGVFGIGGFIAFVVGSIMLMDTDIPAYQIALPVILSLSMVTGLIVFGMLGMALRAYRRPRHFNREAVIGQSLIIEQNDDDRALARYEGELWSVRCADPLVAGDRVRVKAVDGLMLVADKQEK
ncbi:nodulation protein NfeD [uncultured Amphritea sp.]|uniref:NfeD family protein n=1 Tax=Amphritea sp. TaxID=1872502 RepID=UPI0025CDA708|nr:nodulation protein NfeD [uncultured Amphritea sp.]